MEKREKILHNKPCVAVLVSHGFGAGWVSWNPNYPELAFDAAVVDLILGDDPDYKNKIIEYCENKYPDAYLGGLDGLDVCWVQKGQEFIIEEYYGRESILRKDTIEWLTA